MSQRKNPHRLLFCLLALVLVAAPAAAREIRIVGSSTVFPFSAAVAEEFGRRTSFKTPVVESTGSGGGLKLFCAGSGLDTPDIANASRRIKPSEVAMCRANGVADIVEIEVGFDGIVLANSRDTQRYALTVKQIFAALGKQVPVQGKLVPNPYSRWSEIDPQLPDVRIEVLGPPPTSGTRDAFVELAMEAGAKAHPMLAALQAEDKAAFKAVAHAIREDGVYVDAGENDNLIVQKLRANPAALGVFGFSYLEQNEGQIQGSMIDGRAPTFENISSGAYPISRSLFFYLKKAHVEEVPGLTEYVAEFTSERAAGMEGYLADKGLIPLDARALEIVRTRGAQLDVLGM